MTLVPAHLLCSVFQFIGPLEADLFTVADVKSATTIVDDAAAAVGDGRYFHHHHDDDDDDNNNGTRSRPNEDRPAWRLASVCRFWESVFWSSPVWEAQLLDIDLDFVIAVQRTENSFLLDRLRCVKVRRVNIQLSGLRPLALDVSRSTKPRPCLQGRRPIRRERLFSEAADGGGSLQRSPIGSSGDEFQTGIDAGEGEGAAEDGISRKAEIVRSRNQRYIDNLPESLRWAVSRGRLDAARDAFDVALSALFLGETGTGSTANITGTRGVIRELFLEEGDWDDPHDGDEAEDVDHQEETATETESAGAFDEEDDDNDDDDSDGLSEAAASRLRHWLPHRRYHHYPLDGAHHQSASAASSSSHVDNSGDSESGERLVPMIPRRQRRNAVDYGRPPPEALQSLLGLDAAATPRASRDNERQDRQKTRKLFEQAHLSAMPSLSIATILAANASTLVSLNFSILPQPVIDALKELHTSPIADHQQVNVNRTTRMISLQKLEVADPLICSVLSTPNLCDFKLWPLQTLREHSDSSEALRMFLWRCRYSLESIDICCHVVCGDRPPSTLSATPELQPHCCHHEHDIPAHEERSVSNVCRRGSSSVKMGDDNPDDDDDSDDDSFQRLTTLRCSIQALHLITSKWRMSPISTVKDFEVARWTCEATALRGGALISEPHLRIAHLSSFLRVLEASRISLSSISIRSCHPYWLVDRRHYDDHFTRLAMLNLPFTTPPSRSRPGAVDRQDPASVASSGEKRAGPLTTLSVQRLWGSQCRHTVTASPRQSATRRNESTRPEGEGEETSVSPETEFEPGRCWPPPLSIEDHLSLAFGFADGAHT